MSADAAASPTPALDDPYEWPSEKSRALREVIATAPELAGLRTFIGLTDALVKVGKEVRERAYAAAEARGYQGWDTLIFAEGFARERLEWRDRFVNVILLQAGTARLGPPDDQAQTLMDALIDPDTICQILDRVSSAASWLDLLTLPEG